MRRPVESNRIHKSAVYLVPFCAVALAVSLAVRAKPTAFDILSERGILDSKAARLANAPLQLLVHQTAFAGKITVNQEPIAGHVNVYFARLSTVDPRLVGWLAPVRGNCAYIGVDDTIVIDSDFVEQFMMERIWPEVADAFKDKDRIEVNLFLWLIGHEIGHVVNEDRAAHFNASAIEKQPLDDSLRSQAIETRADDFAASRIFADKASAEGVTSMLLDLLNHEMYLKQGKRQIGVGIYATPDLVPIDKRGTHPEFVVRAIRLLRNYAKVGNSSGLDHELDRIEALLR